MVIETNKDFFDLFISKFENLKDLEIIMVNSDIYQTKYKNLVKDNSGENLIKLYFTKKDTQLIFEKL